MIKHRTALILWSIVCVTHYMNAMENPENGLVTNLQQLTVALNEVKTSLQPSQPVVMPKPGEQTKNHKIRCRNGRCLIKGRGHRGKGHRWGKGHRKQQMLAAIAQTPAAQSGTPTTFQVSCPGRGGACRFRQIPGHKGKGGHHRHHGKGHHRHHSKN